MALFRLTLDVLGNCLALSDFSRNASLITCPSMHAGKGIFGFDFNALENPNGKYVAIYNSIMSSMFNPFYLIFPWLDSVPLLHRTSLFKAISDFDALLFGIIESKKKEIENGEEKGEKDLLTLMLEASEKGDGMSVDELRVCIRWNCLLRFRAKRSLTLSCCDV